MKTTIKFWLTTLAATLLSSGAWASLNDKFMCVQGGTLYDQVETNKVIVLDGTTTVEADSKGSFGWSIKVYAPTDKSFDELKEIQKRSEVDDFVQETDPRAKDDCGRYFFACNAGFDIDQLKRANKAHAPGDAEGKPTRCKHKCFTIKWSSNPADWATYWVVADPKTLIVKDEQGRVVWDNGITNIHPTIKKTVDVEDDRISFNEASNVVSVAGTFATNAIPQLYTQVSTNGLPFYDAKVEVTVRHQSGIDGSFYYHTTNNDNQITFKNTLLNLDTYKNDPSSLVLTEANLGTALMHEKAFAQKFVFDFNNNGLFKDDDLLQVIYDAKNITLTNNIEVGEASTNFCGATWKELGKLDKVEVLKDEKAAVIGSYDEVTRTITFTGDSLGDIDMTTGKWTGSFKLTAPAWVKDEEAFSNCIVKANVAFSKYVVGRDAANRLVGTFDFTISVNELVYSEGDVTKKLVMDWNGNGYGETTYTVVFKKEGLKLFTSHYHGTQVYPVKADDYSKFGNVFKYCSAKDAKTILVDDTLKFDEKIAYYIYAPTWIGTNMTSTACITTTYTNDVVASVVTNGVALVNDNGRLRVNYDERDARYFVTNYLFKGVANLRTERGFTWEQYAEPDGQAEYTVRETYVFDTGDMSKKTYKYADGTTAWPLEYKGAKITSKLAYTGDEESEITLEDNELTNETNHVGRARWFFSYDIALPSDITSNNYMRVWMRKRETGAKSWVNDWFCLSSNDFAGAVANLTNNLWTMDAESLERVIATNKVDGTVLKRTTEFIWNSWKVPAEDATPDTTLTIVLDPSENDFFYTQGTNTVEFPNPVEIKPSETKYKGLFPGEGVSSNKLDVLSSDLEDFVISLTNEDITARSDFFCVADLKINAPAGIYGVNYKKVLVNGESADKRGNLFKIFCANNKARMDLRVGFTLADFLAVEEDEDGFRSIVKNYTITWAEGKTSVVKVTMELKDLTLFQDRVQVYPSTVKMAFWKKGFKPEDPGMTNGVDGTYGFITKANNDVIESYTNATPAQYYTKGVNLGTTLDKDYTILRVELPAWLAATNVETLAKAMYRLYGETEGNSLTDVLNPIQGKLDYQRYVIVCQQRPKKSSELGQAFVDGKDYFTTNIVEFAWDGTNYNTQVTLAYSTMADDHAVDKIYDINTNACDVIVGGVGFDKVSLYGSVKLPENPVVNFSTNDFYGTKTVHGWYMYTGYEPNRSYCYYNNGATIDGSYYLYKSNLVLKADIVEKPYLYEVNGVPTTESYKEVFKKVKAGDTVKMLPAVPRGPLGQWFIDEIPSGITLDLTAFSVVTQAENLVITKALTIKTQSIVVENDAALKVLGTNANFKVEIKDADGKTGNMFLNGVLVKDGATFKLKGNLDVTNRCVTVMNGSTLKVSGYVHTRALQGEYADGPAVKALNEEGFEGAKNTVTLGGEVSFSKYVSGTMVKPTAIVEVTDTILTVNGGVHKNEVINDRFAIIAGEGSELTLNGGVVAGRSAVYFAGETLTIPSSATNLYVYGTDEATALVDAGVQYTGDAIIIDNRSGTIDAANVKISGGYFLARNGGSAIAVYGEKLTNIIAGWGYYGGKSPTVADELFYADLGCKRVNCDDKSLVELGYTDMAANKTYTLKYELNGGKSTKTLPQDYTIGSYEALPGAESVTRKDYTFAGWFLDAAFTKPAPTFVQVVDELRETRAAVTVYAKWDAITYTATLDLIGIKYVGGVATQGICKVGTVITYGDYVTTYEGNPTNKFEEKFGQAQQIELATPECKGYTFIAWIDEEGTKYDTLPQGTTDCADHQLTAVWSLDTYTVTYGQYDCPSQPEPVKFTVETPQWLSGENLDMRPGYTWVNIGGFWPHCNWYAAGTTNLVRNTSTFNSDTNVVGVWRNQNTGAYVDGNTRAIVGEGAVFGPAKATKYYGFVLGNPDYTNVVWDMVGTVEFTVSRSKDRYFIRSTETVLGKAKTTVGNYVGGGADVTFTPDNLKQSLHISNTGIEGDTVFAVPALTTTEKANYTLKIDGDDTALLRIAVNAKGKASVNATLADGTKFAVSAQAIAAQGGASYMLPIVWQKKYAGNNLGGFAALVSISNDVAQLISEDYARYDSYNKSGALTTTRYDNWYSDGEVVDGLKLTNGTYRISYGGGYIDAIVTNKTGNLVIYTPQVTKKIKAGKQYTTMKLIKNTVTRNVKTGVLSGTVKVQVNGANGKLVSFKVNGIMSSDKRKGYAYATASAWTDTDKKKYGPKTVFVTISRRVKR